MSDRVVSDILHWYKENHRKLPWRVMKFKNSEQKIYVTWISEVMSQQSTLKTVIPRFEEWMQKLPDLKSLRNSHFDLVQSVWRGLGYYSRAKNLHLSSQQITSFKDFKKYEDFLKIKGVGTYTAKATAAIARDEPVVPVDGNVTRLMARYLNLEDPLNQKKHLELIEKKLVEWAKDIPAGSRGDFAQALIELGATLCRPGSEAKCSSCPLSERCQGFAAQNMHLIPLPKLRSKTQKRNALILVYRSATQKNSFLVRKIPSNWPLGGQWELPWVGEGGWVGFRKNPSSTVMSSCKHLKINNKTKKAFKIEKSFQHNIMSISLKNFVVDLGVWTGQVPQGHAFFSPEEAQLEVTTQTRKALKTL